MRSTIYLVLCLFISHYTYSQGISVSGFVTVEGKPVEFANVYLKGTNTAELTDTTGYYTLTNLTPGNYIVEVSAIGYRKTNQNIQLNKGQNFNLDFNVELDYNLIGEVVISATMKEISKSQSPLPVEVYTPRFFRANPTPSIFESMQNINGVRPQLNCNVCNTGDIHINGLEGPYTMILIDGMPIVSGLSTVYGLTGIPQALIERVEIVKGPASTLYGSEAVGGLVNIITKKPNNAPVFTADVFTSNWGDVNTDLGYKFKIGTRAQSLLGLNYFNYQNIKDNNNDGFTDMTLQNRISIFNKWSFDRKSNRVFSLASRYVYEDRWGGDTKWNTAFRGGDSIYAESIYTSRWEVFGNYELPFKEKMMFQFSANGHNQNSFYGTTPYHAQQYVTFGQLTWNKAVGEYHDILVGASYRYTYYDDNTPATAKDGDTYPSKIALPGIFVQDEITFDQQHKILVGLRYDYNSLHGNVVTPRLSYKVSSKDKKNILRLSTGNGYRVANVFTEDHAALTGARTIEFASELKPETSWNSNINFEKKIYLKNRTYIGLDASLFYTYFTNRIIPDYETDINKIIYDNLDGNSISKGISLNIDIAFESGFKILAGGTLMDVSFTENDVKQRQLLTEGISGVWSVGYTFKKHNLSIDYTGNVYGPMLLPLLGDLDDRPGTSPTWSLQNIQCTKQYGNGFEIYGGIKNILNFTPPANSIARSFDPFDKKVEFDSNGKVLPSPENPNALTFDANYVFAPNQGIRAFLGFRYTFR